VVAIGDPAVARRHSRGRRHSLPTRRYLPTAHSLSPLLHLQLPVCTYDLVHQGLALRKHVISHLSIHSFAYFQSRPYWACRDRHRLTFLLIALRIGANVGLGLDAARHLARYNPKKLILACRNLEKGEKAVKSINETTKVAGGVVETWELDLASFESVKNFAKRGQPLFECD
jgi:hypothetical protein